MNQAFIVTKEHRRFTEFANAVRKEKTIGICHGAAGVGKTNSARRYANWDALEAYINEWGPRGEHDAKHYALANRFRTVFYTPEVLCRPKDLMRALLQRLAAVRGRLSLCADQAAAAKWWLSMPMASVSAEGPMPTALSTRRTSPLMPGCRHQGRACPLRRARMTSNPLIVA